MVTAAKDRLTGPGKTQKLPDGSTLLFNYDIDSAIIKPEHRAFLEQNIVSAANANPGGLRVVIGGSADRLGDAGHNVALSNRRIEAIITFLKQRKPGYRWDFVGFGQGVGESTAERAGDKDNTRDDLFRSVIIEVLKPGQPIPPKPSIPKVFPKKPNVFPRPLPRPNPGTCIVEQDCPFTKIFTIQLLAGVTAGEFVEINSLILLIQDVNNRLLVLYSLSAGGIGFEGLPVTISAVGKPTPFTTSKETKVTCFGPIGGIGSLTIPLLPGIPQGNVSLPTLLRFSFHQPGDLFPSGNVFITGFDTGPVSIPGGGIHVGQFTPHSNCRGKLGAIRT